MQFRPWPDTSATEREQEQLAQWKAEGLFRQTLEATRGGQPFVFFEGPPTANGRPGIHHVFSRTIKDLICRFRALQGRSVTRIAGWDTHGLPVEIEVEKELKLSGKRDIERFGVAEFNARARTSVLRYQSEWEELSDRIGYWLDYDRPYVTYSNAYVETVWWLLHRLRERHPEMPLLQSRPTITPRLRDLIRLHRRRVALRVETEVLGDRREHPGCL